MSPAHSIPSSSIDHKSQYPSNETIPADWDHVTPGLHNIKPRLRVQAMDHQFLPPVYRDTLEWFLKSYDSYTCPVQRSNAFRYFLMRHYGGIYIDPMYGCSHGRKPLLYYLAWVMDSGHDIAGARPNHPYWVMMTESLASRGYSFLLPHHTITHSGGREFEEDIWERYHAQRHTKRRKADRVYRIKMGHREEVFFKPNGRFRDNWDHSFGYIASTKAILGCLLLFAMLTLWLSRSWQARKTHQCEYQKLLPAKDIVGGYGAV